MFRGRGPAEDRPELYVLAEGTTPAGEQFAAHVVSAAGQAWAAVDLSLTGSLTRLYTEAERNLSDWNSKSIAQHKVSLGLGAVARRGRQVVLAQAGPSLAFHLKSGSARIYAPEADHARAIGDSNESVSPQLRGLVVEPGDRLLLINTSALELADQDLIGAILSLPPEQVLRDLYQRVRDARSISVLLLTLPDEPIEEQDSDATDPTEPTIGEEDEYIIGLDTPPPPSAHYQPRLFITPGGKTVRDASEAPRNLEPRSISDWLPAIEPQVLEPLRRVSGSAPFDLIDAPKTTPHRPPRNAPRRLTRPGDVEQAGRRGITREGQSFYSGLRPQEERVPRPEAPTAEAPPVELLARARRDQASLTATSAENAAFEPGWAKSSKTPLVRPRQAMGGRWRGGGAFGTDSRRPSLGWQPSWLLLAICLLVAVVAVGLFVLPSQFRESTDDRYNRLVSAAGAAVAAAQDELDPGAKRDLLTLARVTLLEAKDIRGNESEVLRLIEDVTAALTQMDAIFSPVSVETVTSLEEFGDEPLAVSRLAVGDGVVYMLDPSAGVVVAVSTNGADRNVVFKEDPELSHGAPIAITSFEPTEGSHAVLLLDGQNQLWTLDFSDVPSPISFAAPEGLSVTDIAAVGPSLYALDSTAGTVHRFEFGESGFTTAPDEALNHGALNAARYLLALGGIVTVDNDGTVHRFDDDIVLRLSQAGIDTPLAAAEPPQATSEPGNVAILDPSHDRVVILGFDGTFIRQYQHEDFAQITALVVSDRGSFVFSGGTLRSVGWE